MYPFVRIHADPLYWVVRFNRPGAHPPDYWLEVPAVVVAGRTPNEAADTITRLFLKRAPASWQPREWVTTWLLVRQAFYQGGHLLLLHNA